MKVLSDKLMVKGQEVYHKGNLTKLSDLTNDLPTVSGGTKIVTSPTEPVNLGTGDQWHKEY